MPGEIAEATPLAVLEEARGLALPGAVVRQNPATVYLATLRTPESRKAARDSLRRVLRLLGNDPEIWERAPWWDLSVETCVGIKRHLLDRYAANTAKLAVNILRGVLQWCFLLGYVDAEARERYRAALAVKASDGRLPEPAGRMLTDVEVMALRKACESQRAFLAARDTAILGCGVALGLRRIEIACLLTLNLSDDTKILRVRGKGGKVRDVPVTPWVGGALEDWLAQRDRVTLSTQSMFVPVLGGFVLDRPMSKWQVWRTLKTLGERAGVRMAPHDLRRTCISTLVEATDLLRVGQIVGHEDPATTRRYDRRPAEDRAQAMHALEKWGGPIK